MEVTEEQELKQKLTKKMYSNSYVYLARPFRTVVDKAYEVLSQHTQRARVENEQESVSRFVDAMFKEAKPIDQCYLAMRSFSDKYVAQLSTKDSTNKEEA